MKRLPLFIVLLWLSGCASYSQGFQKVEVLLSQQKPQEALQELEKNPSSGKNELLYLLDKAMLQRMSGQYSQSNQTFEKAKVLMDKLAAISVVEQAGALTINDNMMSYEGEDYEQVAVHVYAALNYIELGLWDDARVEALQVDVRLKKIAEKKGVKETEDAFSRYITGMIYEQGGEWSDAMIAYRSAYTAYQKSKQPIPLFLKQDLLRLSQYLGLDTEFRQYQKIFAIEQTESVRDLKHEGEVLLLLHHSLAPIKYAENVLVMGDKGVQHRVSLPNYRSRPSYLSRARLVVGDMSAETVLVDDFDMLARQSLERHKPAMIARLIVRTVLKHKMSERAEKNGGSLAGLLVNVAGAVTETADTRSWLTLPKNIHFARLPLKAGSYASRLELLGAQGQVVATLDLGQVEVVSGKKTVVEKTYVSPYIAPKQ